MLISSKSIVIAALYISIVGLGIFIFVGDDTESGELFETGQKNHDNGVAERSATVVGTTSPVVATSAQSVSEKNVSTEASEAEVNIETTVEDEDVIETTVTAAAEERGDLVISMRTKQMLPFKDVTLSSAQKLCALAAGKACVWNGQYIQQSKSLGDVLYGSTNEFFPQVAATPALLPRVSFVDTRPGPEKYRMFVVVFDIMGRPYGTYEAHTIGGGLVENVVTFEWDYRIRFLEDDGRVGVIKLPASQKFSLLVVGVETGRFGRVDNLVVPGLSEEGLPATNLRPYIPGHGEIFRNWTGRGRLIDGGEGFDTVEYDGLSYRFDFIKATSTPRFLTSINGSDGNYTTEWFYDNYDHAIAVVSGDDRVDVLLSIEQIVFTDTVLEVPDLMRRLEESDGIIYSERGVPSKGIIY